MVPMSNIPTGFGLVVYAAAHACGGSSVEAGVAPLTHAQFGTQCPFLNPPNAYIICVPPYHLCGYVGPPPPPPSIRVLTSLLCPLFVHWPLHVGHSGSRTGW